GLSGSGYSKSYVLHRIFPHQKLLSRPFHLSAAPLFFLRGSRGYIFRSMKRRFSICQWKRFPPVAFSCRTFFPATQEFPYSGLTRLTHCLSPQSWSLQCLSPATVLTVAVPEGPGEPRLYCFLR